MKYCNLIGPLQVVYSTYYPANTYYTRRKHLLHPLRTLITFPANTYYTCSTECFEGYSLTVQVWSNY